MTVDKPRSVPLSFLRSRLSQRIVLSVFGSILAIEGLILIPSVIRREREFLNRLTEQSTAGLAVAMGDLNRQAPAQPLSDEALLATLSQLTTISMVEGGALYDPQGTLIGSFGEAPQASFSQLSSQQKPATLDRSRRRYETAQIFSIAGEPYGIVISHDTTRVHAEVIAFIFRILGLVLLISAVVTLTTMIVLRSILIAPILALSQDLLKAAPAALQGNCVTPAPFASQRYSRRTDELGTVVSAFEQMFARISQAIAHRQQAEARLKESESRFRALVDQAAESIFVLDESGTIISVNQFVLRYLGYPQSELIGHSIFEINPVFTPEDYAAHWERLKSGKPETFEGIHRRKDGSTYPIEVRSSLISVNGEQRVLSLVRDISDRKKAERVQARLAEIGELAAMIVHEVRNPFSTVYMALSAFKQMELPPRGQMRLSLALEEAERLKRLLNEILTYAREQKLDTEPIEMNALCQELGRSLRESPAAKERILNLSCAPEAVTVRGDRDKLKQVFINLITNACEAIAPQDCVTWELQCIPDRSPQLKIQIHNGGEPIAPEVLPKLTQPFVSTKASGNGLGLAITKRIVEAHGGQLQITSTAAEGTTVTVWLPLAPPTL